LRSLLFGRRWQYDGFQILAHCRPLALPSCGAALYPVRGLFWSVVASPIPRLRTTPIFKVGLQQGFALGEMGFND
jgi:hypothetical protein